MADIWMALMMDLSSIFAASALLSLGGVATDPGVPPMHTTIWVGAVLQVRLGRARVAMDNHGATGGSSS
jgi:hypothetical protein